MPKYVASIRISHKVEGDTKSEVFKNILAKAGQLLDQDALSGWSMDDIDIWKSTKDDDEE